MTTMKKFDDHKFANACIYYHDNGAFDLVSYSTTVITITGDGWMHINGLYSVTTIKHIGWFAKMIGTSYQTCKKLFIDNMDMNIYTGEIKAWE